ncbi:hypothetical protein [Methylobacterium bullatum]|uniref:hypothetical protein n=1 Tax=Methylobacterium bullatum TaxID=570505 RepID=UPI0017827E42|nr:hypothetical protein [Methylobacterium bullatum]
MTKYQRPAIYVGQIFVVELADNIGFGYGYVTLTQPSFGHLINIFRTIGDTRELPSGLRRGGLILTDRLVSDSPFMKSRNNPVPWVLLDVSYPEPDAPQNTLFRVGNKIFDMQTDLEIKDITINADSLPTITFPMDDRLTYELTALLSGKQWRLNEEKDVYEIF